MNGQDRRPWDKFVEDWVAIVAISGAFLMGISLWILVWLSR